MKKESGSFDFRSLWCTDARPSRTAWAGAIRKPLILRGFLVFYGYDWRETAVRLCRGALHQTCRNQIVDQRVERRDDLCRRCAAIERCNVCGGRENRIRTCGTDLALGARGPDFAL